MEPDSPPQITYQAYKSKRHSRTVSNPHMVPNLNISRPSSVVGSPVLSASIPAATSFLHQNSTEKEKIHEVVNGLHSTLGLRLDPVSSHELPSLPFIDSPGGSSEPTSAGASSNSTIPSPVLPALDKVSVPSLNGHLNGHNETEAGPSSMPSSPKSSPSEFEKQKPVTRKSTTFRRIPLRNPSRSPLPSSPLRPIGPHAMVSPVSATSLVPEVSNEKQLPTISSANIGPTLRVAQSPEPVPPEYVEPPPRSTSLIHPPKPPSKGSPTTASPSPVPSPAPSLVNLPNVSAAPRPSAPYRPGFQPRGIYRPRTDEFSAVRKDKRELGRVERTKLERRLEKLIDLHFPSDEDKATQLNRHVVGRRTSSIFDLDFSDLQNIDASSLWKGMLQSQGTKAEIRAAEQRITPWMDDATVSKCPLCSASFHPLTNRKHHCRLCGQIICSLPVKHPQRPVACSLLFVVDPKTRRIEEVGEGVDYGVRKRRTPSVSIQGKGKEMEETLLEDEKFLKGVRICKDCRPILLRRQYRQEVLHVPTFARLYEAFIMLEKEIEDSLPQFQELIINLGNDVQPTKEASAARKRILEAFAQYDTLSKRIRALPSPEGPGKSQDRIQLAIFTRANLFLQRNMFPLQALPQPKKTKTSSSPNPEYGSVIDPDSEMAHALQPLLEQEALLESFVEEAKARRKFEDAKILKINLSEIRAEIDRVVTNAEGGTHRAGRAGSGTKVSK